MAQKPETVFINSINRYLPANLYYMKNNNEYNGGIPDSWYSGIAKDLWVEYKFFPRTPQRGIVWLCKPKVKKPILSVLQQNWLAGRHDEGRNVAVIVGCPDGGVLLRNKDWQNAIQAVDFRAMLMSRKELAQWITGETMR